MRVLIISADGFEDTELLVPLYRLREARVDVDIASTERGTIRGKHGYEVEAPLSAGDPSATDYDLLLLPGGEAPATLREDDRVLDFLRVFFGTGKPVAAICHGPQILVSAGLLEGRTATAWSDVQPELEQAGALVKDEELVEDGNLITSRQPSDLPAFLRAVMNRLGAS